MPILENQQIAVHLEQISFAQSNIDESNSQQIASQFSHHWILQKMASVYARSIHT